MSKFYRISPTNHGWGFGYGFFSNYRICLEQLIHHHESKGMGIPYIDWGQTTWVEGFNPFESTELIPNGNPFDDWFDQEIPKFDDEIIDCLNGPRPDLIDHAKNYFDLPNQLDRQQKIDQLYIKPKNFIIDEVDKIYRSEFEGQIVLGVMARGSEYNVHHPMYGRFTVDDYIREIGKILEINTDITKLFIVSDETEYIEAIYKKFPSSYFVPNIFRRTDETSEYINRVHCWMNVSSKRKNHCQLLGEETIIQTKLLGKCNYLFGRHCGILSGAILWNENIKKVITI